MEVNREKRVGFINGDGDGLIGELIEYLKDCKDKGATHYKIYWGSKWFEVYKMLTDEEMKQEKIKHLQSQIDKLNGSNTA